MNITVDFRVRCSDVLLSVMRIIMMALDLITARLFFMMLEISNCQEIMVWMWFVLLVSLNLVDMFFLNFMLVMLDMANNTMVIFFNLFRFVIDWLVVDWFVVDWLIIDWLIIDWLIIDLLIFNWLVMDCHVFIVLFIRRNMLIINWFVVNILVVHISIVRILILHILMIF